MNQTSASGNSSSAFGDATSVLTTVHLVWIVVLALLVIAGILYGMRVKRRRVHAERQVVEHAREAGIEPQPAAPDEAASPPPPFPPPAPVEAVESSGGPADGPVTQLKGLGPKVAARLAELGVTTVGQIAALDHDAGQRLDAQLGAFQGRLERDRWIEQARFLAAGDRAGFEAVFGKL